jgi:hypothetical protein
LHPSRIPCGHQSRQELSTPHSPATWKLIFNPDPPIGTPFGPIMLSAGNINAKLWSSAIEGLWRDSLLELNAWSSRMTLFYEPESPYCDNNALDPRGAREDRRLIPSLNLRTILFYSFRADGVFAIANLQTFGNFLVFSPLTKRPRHLGSSSIPLQGSSKASIFTPKYTPTPYHLLEILPQNGALPLVVVQVE